MQVLKLKNKQSLHRAKVASLESFDGKHATFFFLKGDEVNGRNWGVTEESIPLNIKTAKGMPYVITAEDFIKNSPYGDIWDHPSLEHLVPLGLASPGTVDLNDLPRIIDFQKKFKVGTISDVFKSESDGTWRVTVAIDEPYKDMNLPPFVSPAVWQLDLNEPDTAMTKWRVLHLAGLKDRPAYGNQAVKKAECYGTSLECKTQLRAASTGIQFTPCQVKEMIGKLKTEKIKLATMISGDFGDVTRQNIHDCKKKDQNGICLETNAKKSI